MPNKIVLLLSGLILFIAVAAYVHAASPAKPTAPAPIQAVMTPYLQIHDALAKDSLDGVAAAATTLSKAALDNKIFPTELSQQAQALAQAKDLDSARAAFKPLSDTLIKVLADNNASDNYTEAYCPMVKAYWLQTGTTVSNPFGSSMATCGSIIHGKSTPSTFMQGGCCN